MDNIQTNQHVTESHPQAQKNELLHFATSLPTQVVRDGMAKT
jgi:hypothetical protein